MAPFDDPHSFTDSSHPLTTHVALSLFFDFPSSTVNASALISLASPHSGPFSLDTRSLTIHSVLDALSSAPILFSLSQPDPIKGCVPTTFNKALPFVYTQCQSIHARSVFPCQDTTAARICYSLLLNIPRHLSAVMAARHVERRAPGLGEGSALSGGVDSLWCGEGRVVEEFVMEQPIPPYLFAFAVGEIGFKEVSPRTRVYSESAFAVLDAAAREFAETEEMTRQGEKLFGPL